MIRKYRTGNPFPTESVVREIPASPGVLPYFTHSRLPDGRPALTYTMADDELVYGLGEQVRGMNKRGWHYISHATDDAIHTESRVSLYAAHNFLLVFRKNTGFALFIDNPGTVEYDVGYSEIHTLRILLPNGDSDFYLLDGNTPKELVKEFRGLIGQSYIPPLWGMGYGQSRWGYKTEEDFRRIRDRLQENGIPVDAIYMDIDYMDHYKDFTVNRDAMDLPALSAEMKRDGIRLVPIIDAGVKQEEGYSVYDEGVEKGYFCKKPDGSDFIGAVWPGLACFPDFLRPEVRDWFGKKYKILMDMGIEGFWNDMNEPAIFYTPEQITDAVDRISLYKGTRGMVFEDFLQFQAALRSAVDTECSYKLFCHSVDGKRIPHEQVHNLYGYNMTRAAGDAFREIEPDKRLLLFSRSSFIGSHRSGGIWTGDNHAWWSHILLCLQQMPGLNMCGYLYCGCDIGGFGDNTTEDLLIRWIQLGIFTPLMRNHNGGKRDQEPFLFSDPKAFADLIGIRYGLLPYLYSEFVKAALGDECYFRPLALEFPEDDQAAHTEDQLLVGDSIMIAPVYTQNAVGRYVYLPEEMLLIRMRSMEDFDTQVLPAGHHYVSCGLKEMIFFLRKNRLLPCCAPASCTDRLNLSDLKVFCFGDGEYALYQDDGFTTNYTDPAHFSHICCRDGALCSDNPGLTLTKANL